MTRTWFMPVKRKTFIRDFLVIQAGFSLFGLAIAMLVQANLGTSPWVTLNVALSQLTGLTVGNFIAIVGFLVLLIVLALRERIGWGTLGNIVIIGPWADMWLGLLPPVESNLPVQVALLLGSVWVMGLASAIYIGVDAGAGPRDSLMLAISRVSGRSIRFARAVIELTVVSAGWLLGGPVGIGTVVFALLIGPSVQLWFKILGVKGQNKE